MSMNKSQFLLTKLAEEGCEVAQIALKTQQFGFFETCPGLSENNVQRVHAELNDLMAIIEMLNEYSGFNYKPDPIQIAAKKEKVNKFARKSEQLGQIFL